MSEMIVTDWSKSLPASAEGNAGRWVKGQSGNPKGRPPGRPDARTKITRSLLDDGPAVARVVIDAALEGDLQACSIVLSRIAPAIKSQAERVVFEFDAAASMPAQIEAVLVAIAAGDVAPDVGREIIAALGTLAEARAAVDLEDRIRALEMKNDYNSV